MSELNKISLVLGTPISGSDEDVFRILDRFNKEQQENEVTNLRCQIKIDDIVKRKDFYVKSVTNDYNFFSIFDLHELFLRC